MGESDESVIGFAGSVTSVETVGVVEFALLLLGVDAGALLGPDAGALLGPDAGALLEPDAAELLRTFPMEVKKRGS